MESCFSCSEIGLLFYLFQFIVILPSHGILTISCELSNLKMRISIGCSAKIHVVKTGNYFPVNIVVQAEWVEFDCSTSLEQGKVLQSHAGNITGDCTTWQTSPSLYPRRKLCLWISVMQVEDRSLDDGNFSKWRDTEDTELGSGMAPCGWHWAENGGWASLLR